MENSRGPWDSNNKRDELGLQDEHITCPLSFLSREFHVSKLKESLITSYMFSMSQSERHILKVTARTKIYTLKGNKRKEKNLKVGVWMECIVLSCSFRIAVSLWPDKVLFYYVFHCRPYTKLLYMVLLTCTTIYQIVLVIFLPDKHWNNFKDTGKPKEVLFHDHLDLLNA